MTELVKPGTTVAHVNWGRWIARCSWQIRCDAAIDLTGSEAGFRCPECGGDNDIVWPDGDTMQSIARILLMRPHRRHQNWLPGEKVDDLLHENALHGILTHPVAELPPVGDAIPLIGVANGRIVHDALPHLNPRRELVG